MRRTGTWKPVTAAEYDGELDGVLKVLDALRACVTERYAGRGATAAAPRLAADLRDLRETVGALLAVPGMDER